MGRYVAPKVLSILVLMTMCSMVFACKDVSLATYSFKSGSILIDEGEIFYQFRSSKSKRSQNNRFVSDSPYDILISIRVSDPSVIQSVVLLEVRVNTQEGEKKYAQQDIEALNIKSTTDYIYTIRGVELEYSAQIIEVDYKTLKPDADFKTVLLDLVPELSERKLGLFEILKSN